MAVGATDDDDEEASDDDVDAGAEIDEAVSVMDDTDDVDVGLEEVGTELNEIGMLSDDTDVGIGAALCVTIGRASAGGSEASGAEDSETEASDDCMTTIAVCFSPSGITVACFAWN